MDLQGLSVTTLASASVTIPRHQITALLTNPKTGAILADMTGANAVVFPDVLLTLTVTQRRQLLDLILNWLLHTKGGVAL